MQKDKNSEQAMLLKLRDIRRAKGMSLNALADQVGIDYQRVGRMERGETQMTIEMLQRIAKVLQVPVAQLLPDSDLNQLKNTLAHETQPATPVDLIPTIYEELERFCERHRFTAENNVKVHIAAVMFQAIQDIRTSVKADQAIVKPLFQAFDAIFERLVLSQQA